ncbi:MAG: hypothetical protein RMK84_06775 [Oscillochloridaceae bacterium]|nr:hypothetical protein [Chloroflexaceae bacterium]MDW8389812.1 hypothetical protein [Oscillochloridaceae bacterium]
MTQPLATRRLTRRQLLGVAAGAALGGAALTYGLEERRLAPPLAGASGLADPPPSAVPVPDAPLLVLTNPAADPDFSPYLIEILRTEGLTTLRSAPLEQVGAAELAGFSVVVLAPGPVRNDQVALLRAYVGRGGALVGIRPDAKLASLFGVRPLGAAAPGDYLYIVTGLAELDGLEETILQLHGPYDRLALDGARIVARSGNGDPLVTLSRFGEGMTALWAFDLARCVALIRQGNPAAAGQERDDLEGLRATDLFVDWIDLDRIGIPQADEHQRLLARVIEELAAAGPPLPRLWYFPGGAPALIVATGDAHGSRVSHIEQLLGPVERRGGTVSVYYTPPRTSTVRRLARRARWSVEEIPVLSRLFKDDDPIPSPATLAKWRERGHEFGMHPYVEDGLETGYNLYWSEFIKYGYGPLPPTVRTHRILWYGWVDNALVQARYGVRMNLDHYHAGGVVRRADGTWAAGYLSGTGLPMRFVNERGTLLSVYQQPTHLVDEHLMSVFDTGHEAGFDGATAATVTIAQIAESVRRYPAALGLQCHVDPFLFGGEKAANVGYWLNESLDYAIAQGMPILSAERWLAFSEARAAAYAERIIWDATTRRLAFELGFPANPGGTAAVLLPLRHGGASLREVRVHGSVSRQMERRLAGRRYALVTVPAGRSQIEADYGVL